MCPLYRAFVLYAPNQCDDVGENLLCQKAYSSFIGLPPLTVGEYLGTNPLKTTIEGFPRLRVNCLSGVSFLCVPQWQNSQEDRVKKKSLFLEQGRHTFIKYDSVKKINLVLR